MYIETKELILYAKDIGNPIRYYFDRKTYTIIEVETPNTPPRSDEEHYERYIPMFQVDEEQIEEAYLESLNNPKLTKDFRESHIDIAEYLIRNYSYYKADDWYQFHDEQVCKIATDWCEQNHIKYRISSTCSK